MTATLTLAKALIARPSITPDDAGCQHLIAERLQRLGFSIEQINAGGVHNLWARRGHTDPLFVFAGHTDVVPTGPLDAWRGDPFDPWIDDGRLYGRGAADMKGSLAAMVVALEQFVAQHPNHQGSLAVLLTSDEEGPATHGTCHVIDTLQKRGEHIRWCLVGEPSSQTRLGDTLKIGRRGSLTGNFIIQGKQGHVAYPEKARNPIHEFAPALSELCAIQWDQGYEGFPPTSFQVVNLNSGTGATNVIPNDLTVQFNFRFSPALTPEKLKISVTEVLQRHHLSYKEDWQLSAKPFLTQQGLLVDAVRLAIRECAGIETELSTSGGTSDARFIAPTGAEVVELGPVNASIHQVNEWVNIDELEQLTGIYSNILTRLMTS